MRELGRAPALEFTSRPPGALCVVLKIQGSQADGPRVREMTSHPVPAAVSKALEN